MKRPLLMAGLLLLLFAPLLPAQTNNNLNWASSFSPPWANGLLHRHASNVGGNSVDCDADVNLHGGGVFTLTMGTYGVLSPSVAGAVFTVPGSPERLQVTPDFNNKNAYTTITLEFTTAVSYVNFRIADIDKELPGSTSYLDRVTITGEYNNTNYYPTITKYDPVTDPNFIVISGNSAYANTSSGQGGNTDSDATDQRGTINVNFAGTLLTSVTIRYDNAPGVDNNPDFQSIAIGDISFLLSPLPVTLTDFSGHRRGENIVLNWTTEQELQSASFEIERNRGNTSWEKIGTVQAAGNSNSRIDYGFTDIDPQGSLLLYRLKQIDIDDHFKYSGIVRISSIIRTSELQVYPNPVKDKVSIGVYSPTQQMVLVTLIDASGRTVKSESRNLFAGENNIMLSGLNPLLPSIYQLLVQDMDGNLIGRSQIIKQ